MERKGKHRPWKGNETEIKSEKRMKAILKRNKRANKKDKETGNKT